MPTLKQRLHNIYETMGVLSYEQALTLFTISQLKEWLKQKHQEWISNIQYEELFPNEVIPKLLEELNQ